MKHFKKLSVGALLSLGLVGSAFAEHHVIPDTIAFTGDVHAASAYQYRGYQFSDGEPSIGATLTATHASGIFGTIKSDSIKLSEGTGRHQTQNALTIGYGQDLYGVKVNGGLSHNFFIGKDHVSDLSFSEAFVGAEYKGGYAKVSTVIDGAKLGVPGVSLHDTYGELGYTHNIGKYSIGGDVGYSWYDNKAGGVKDGWSVAQVRAGYKVDSKVDVTVTHQFAGDNFYGDTAAGTHKTFVKVAYKF